MTYNNLFEPINIRGLEMDNRIIFPAMVTKMADENGYVEENLIEYHIERVKGGTGLNMLEATSVHKETAPKKHLSIAEDIYIAKLKELVDRIHLENGKIGIQLWQSGMYDIENLDRQIFVPSDYKTKSGRKIEAMSIDKINEVIESFGVATKRAMEAGFDAVEINVGHNDILHTFLSEAFNKRNDEYGGSLENRSKLLIEIIQSIRENMSKEIPLFMKIISQDDDLEKGLTIDDIIKVINIAKDEGVDVVTVSRGNISTDAVRYEVPTLDMEIDYNMENTIKIKENTDILISAIGRIISPIYANKLIEDNKTDLVSIGRGQLADPFFVQKSKEDREEDIIKCVGCNQGCYDGLTDPLFQYISCLRNPAIGFEERYKVGKTEKPQKVAVVGGGIGGMMCTLLLKERGHEPVLFERGKKLGGQYKLLGNSPRKIEIKKFMERTIFDVEALDIEMRMGTKFEDEMVVDEDFESVVIATGSDPKTLDVKGNKLDNVVNYIQVLDKEVELDGKVAIIGSNSIGLEVAEFLYRKGNEIVILEEGKKLASDLGSIRKIMVKDLMKKKDIDVRLKVEIKEIKEDKIKFKHNGKIVNEDIDYVVMAVGAASNKSNYIKQYCQDREIPFYVVGDALIPRKALDAISEAYNISLFEIE